MLTGLATYNITYEGKHEGALAVDVAATGTRLQVSMELDMPVPLLGGARPRYASVFTMDIEAASGALLAVDAPDSTWFPWNDHATWPVPIGLWTSGARGGVERGLFPLAPILAAWNQAPTGELDLSTIAPIHGSWRQDDSWYFSAAGHCLIDCLALGTNATVWLNATGTSSALPTAFSWSSNHPEYGAHYEFTATSMRSDGNPVRPWGRAPGRIEPVSSVSCGWIPCEESGWDPRYSLAGGLAALQATPEWDAWAAQHPDHWPLGLAVGGSPAGVLTTEVLILSTYVFFFVGSDGQAEMFVLRQPNPAVPVGGPIVLEQTQTIPRVDDPEQFRRDGWLSPSADELVAIAVATLPPGQQMSGFLVRPESNHRAASDDDVMQIVVSHRDADFNRMHSRIIAAYGHVAETYRL